MTNDRFESRLRIFTQLCKERGIPVTVQRRAILEALLDSSEHPTVDDILTALRLRLPDLSHTTVYRVLELLIELGLARKTCSPGSQCRYDANIERHHHLVCLVCERMVDLEDASLNDIPIPDRRATGYELVDYSIQFRGTCPECLRKQKGRGTPRK